MTSNSMWETEHVLLLEGGFTKGKEGGSGEHASGGSATMPTILEIALH